MKTYPAPVLAAIASGDIALVQLVYLGFAVPIALNTSTWDLSFGGVAYQGAAGLGTVSPITDKPGEIMGLTFEVNFGDSALISLALDDSDVVQGTPCTIRTALIETVNYTVLDAPVEWVGTLDTMSIGEDGNQTSVRVTAESRAVDLMRGTPRFYSDAEQRAINPTDASFVFVVDQIGKTITWPARAYYYQ